MEYNSNLIYICHETIRVILICTRWDKRIVRDALCRCAFWYVIYCARSEPRAVVLTSVIIDSTHIAISIVIVFSYLCVYIPIYINIHFTHKFPTRNRTRNMRTKRCERQEKNRTVRTACGSTLNCDREWLSERRKAANQFACNWWIMWWLVDVCSACLRESVRYDVCTLCTCTRLGCHCIGW